MTLDRIVRELDLERDLVAELARDAASPDTRARWERVLDDLDGAAALVRRAARAYPKLSDGSPLS